MPDPQAPASAGVSDRSESWPVAWSRDLFRDDWVMALRADEVSRPGHEDERFRRLVLEHPGAVVVLAVDDEERVLVLHQYRHAVRRRLVELPAGLCDVDHEDRLTTAKRELLEEAEVEASTWEHLLTTHPSPGISSERIDVYLAQGLSPAHRGDFEPVHEEAEMETAWVPLDELVAAVLSSKVTDGPLGIAVLAHALQKGRGTYPAPSQNRTG
jgi:8-oxo-dGTP pyrophosphatase MutT (NUDIX family)